MSGTMRTEGNLRGKNNRRWLSGAYRGGLEIDDRAQRKVGFTGLKSRADVEISAD